MSNYKQLNEVWDKASEEERNEFVLDNQLERSEFEGSKARLKPIRTTYVVELMCNYYSPKPGCARYFGSEVKTKFVNKHKMKALASARQHGWRFSDKGDTARCPSCDSQIKRGR